MAKDYKPEDIMFPEQKIVSSEIVSEMKSSFIDYAMSVIVRACASRRARRSQARAQAHTVRHVRGRSHVGQAVQESRPPASATCWAAITPTATARSTTRWCVWRRTSPCATRWWTATATSAPWTATPLPPTDTRRRACRAYPTRCCATWRRRP